MTWGENPHLSQSASEQKEEVGAPDEEPHEGVLGFRCSSHSATLTSDFIQKALGAYSEAVGLQVGYAPWP